MDILHNLRHYIIAVDIILFGIVLIDLYRPWQVAFEVAVEVVALLSVGLLSPVVWVWVIIFSLFFWVLGICSVLLFLMLSVAYKFYYYTFQTQQYINHNNSHSSIILRPKSTSLMVSMNCTFYSTIFLNRRIYFSVE